MTPRRSFLTGTAAVAATVAVPAVALASAANPDAKLIRACNEYLAFYRGYNSIMAEGFDEAEDTPLFQSVNARLDALRPQMDEFERFIVETPAVSAAGVLAKARAAWCFAAYGEEDPIGPDWDDRFYLTVLADIINQGERSGSAA